MTTIHEDFKNLFVEIPPVCNEDATEKLNFILILYSKMLSKIVSNYNIGEYFSHLHIMSYDIKAIRNKHVNESVKQSVFYKTRAMLINDLYALIQLTAISDESVNYLQAQ